MEVVVALAAAAAALAGAPTALGDACGLPDSGPLWVDFAGRPARARAPTDLSPFAPFLLLS
ncbi:MAG TPA: hypothetical protein VGH35_12100 [Gaiellaceae bacterium]